MYALFAPLIGGLITVMNGLNSLFSARVGNLAAVLVIHVVGLVVVSALLLVRKEARTATLAETLRHEPWLFAGGIVGVATVFSCNLTFGTIGASLSVALALLGQTIGSIAIDSTGFLGRRKYPLSARSVPGILLALAGIAIMAGSLRAQLPSLILAFATGLFTLLSFTLNSQLSLRRGVLGSARINYLAGLATTLLIVAIVRPSLPVMAVSLLKVPLLLLVGGGTLGVIMVAATNFIFPKIPALSATLLMFAGQALSGVIVDALGAGLFDPRKLFGSLVVLAGLAVNALLGRRGGGRAGENRK